MKHIVTLGLLLFVAVSCGHSHKQSKVKVNPQAVYVCSGKSAKRYHSVNNCLGLGRCSGTVEVVSIEEADYQGKTPCRLCVP